MSEEGELLERAGRGDPVARDQLLAVYRERLRQMIAVRMDRRLLARFDPSDVVQEALADASQRLTEYLQQRPVPFYPWLRALAWNRLVDLHRRHLRAQRRSVLREEDAAPGLPDESVLELAGRLFAPGPTPSGQLLREELCRRVQLGLGRLDERDREVLVLRYLEKLSIPEIAAVLGITENNVTVRHFRALQRLRKLLGRDLTEGQP